MTRFTRAFATWQRTVAGIDVDDMAALRAAEDAMGRAFHAAIDATWADAYRLGFGSRAGGVAGELPPSFLGDIDRQRRFATSFAQDIAAGAVGKKGRMPFGQRAALYANGVEGAFNAGAVEGGIQGELIWWRLGSADHCFSCPLLASSSPYTRDTLPTVPRSGATPCGNNCKCHLEFAPAAGPRVAPTPPPFPDDVLTPPPPPPGLRRPTPEEEAALRDLELRAAFAARRAAEAVRIGERDRWMRRRADADAARGALIGERALWSPGGIPSDPVITGATLGEAQVMDMARTRGLDGPTVAKGRAAVEGAANGALAALDGLFAALAAFSAGVAASPDADADEPTLLSEAAVGLDAGARVALCVVGDGLEATLRSHVAALGVLADGAHPVEVGPFGARWPELVAAGGTWVVGDPVSVDAFLTAWRKSAYGRSGLAVAPWRERA